MGHQLVKHSTQLSANFTTIQGTKFCSQTQTPSKEAYITAIEEACTKLPPGEAEELRAETSHLPRYNCLPTKPNITMDEFKAIKELWEDQSREMLTADKGVTMVIMDKKDYTDKALCLLGNSSTYRTIFKDLTNKFKNKLIGIPKDIKQRGGLKGSTYNRLYPTSAAPQSVIAFPKSIKLTPLRPIVSSRGSITYGVAKELEGIIYPLGGQSPDHLKNTQHFVQQIQQVKLEQGRSSHHMI